jgi:sterol desaturase/sphingolipid hydroxylase (fatty acid hydroxylase superfamily)
MSVIDLITNLSTPEYVMIFSPVISYWVYSTFFYVLSLLNLTSVEIHKLSTQNKRPPNRMTVQKVVLTVAIQHVIQIILTIFLTVITENNSHSENNEMEEWYMVFIKIAVGTAVLDTYQVYNI